MNTERNAARLLAAIYKLSGGRAGVTVQRKDLLTECDRVNLFGMTDDEFKSYRLECLAAKTNSIGDLS